MGIKGQRLQAWTVSNDGISAIHVLDNATGREIGRFYDGPMHVTALAFSPDGARLASGHIDSTILIWDLKSVLAGKTM